jgi:hypothetical protein
VCLQDLHVISLILLLRIRLTRRGGVCWSEPRGIPRPAYDDGGCASLSLEASQDWHKALDAKPDEEYVPDKVNLGPQGVNSARGDIIRPTMKIIRPGDPAQPECSNPAQPELVKGGLTGIPARPDPPDPAEPGSGEVAGMPGRRPGRGEGRRPTEGAGPAGGSMPAQPGKTLAAQPGQREAGAPRPSRGTEQGAQAGEEAGPAGMEASWPSRGLADDRPSRGRRRRPSRSMTCWPAQDEAVMPAQIWLFRPSLPYSGQVFYVSAREAIIRPNLAV